MAARELKRFGVEVAVNGELPLTGNEQDILKALCQDMRVANFLQKLAGTIEEVEVLKEDSKLAQKEREQTNAEIKDQRANIEEQKAKIEDQRANIQEHEAKIEDQRASIEEQKAKIEEQRANIQEHKTKIKQLISQLRIQEMVFTAILKKMKLKEKFDAIPRDDPDRFLYEALKLIDDDSIFEDVEGDELPQLPEEVKIQKEVEGDGRPQIPHENYGNSWREFLRKMIKIIADLIRKTGLRSDENRQNH